MSALLSSGEGSPPRGRALLLTSARAGQGIEQQKLWLNIEESDLPLEEIFETVKKQLAEDAKSGEEPPLNSDHLA